MGHSSFGFRATLALSVLFFGCGGSSHSAGTPSPPSMDATEARAFIAEIQRERAIPIDRSPVANMDQLLEALTRDQVGRFVSAEQLVAGKPGIEALALHAAIELAWSDDLMSFARIFEELGKKAEFEVKRLSEKRQSSLPLSEAEAKALEQNQKNAAFDAKAQLALEVLAAERLNAAGAIVDQTLRQFPKDPLTYRGAAYFSLLSREWPNFDAAMTWFVEGEGKDAGLVYLRGFEALKRRRAPAQATALFRDALRLEPNFVRAQAKLVLSASDVDARYREFEKLRAAAPEHPMVSLLGPSITSDYELSSSLRGAREAQVAAPSLDSTLPAAPNP